MGTISKVLGVVSGAALVACFGCHDDDDDIEVHRHRPPRRVVVVEPPPPRVVYVREAPPPLRVEVLPRRSSPRHVWVGGYWSWEHSRYAWQPGRWAVPPRRSAVWVPHTWHRGGRGWQARGGHWR